MVPVRWLPSVLQTTNQFEGLSEHIQQLARFNNPHRLRFWSTWIQQLRTHREDSILWKDKREFITHPRHALQPSTTLRPVPLPDKHDTVTHFWVERVDGEGFAEVNAAHIPEFRARGFVGWRHKLCKQLVFFYMPSSLDAAAESRIAEILQPLEYTEGPMAVDLELNLDNIPCDAPTMESQMAGVHGMERLEHGGRILVSRRMADALDRVSGEGGTLPETEEGEVGGFDDARTYTPSSSGTPGPIHATTSISVAVRDVGPLPSNRQRGKHKPWKQRDAPSDRKQRLWSEWVKLANFFNSHQDLINDLEPLPATVPGKHSNLKKPGWEGLLNIAVELCKWIHRNCDMAAWMVSQHSDDKECLLLWKAAVIQLDYKRVWNTPHVDMPPEDEPVLQEWLRAKELWLSMIPE